MVPQSNRLLEMTLTMFAWSIVGASVLVSSDSPPTRRGSGALTRIEGQGEHGASSVSTPTRFLPSSRPSGQAKIRGMRETLTSDQIGPQRSALSSQPVLLEQVFRVGDIRVEMGRPLRLMLAITDHPSLSKAATEIAHALSSGEPMAPTTALTGPIQITLHWDDPVGRPRVVPIQAGEGEVHIPEGPERTARYCLVWRSTDGLFDLMVPSAPRRFVAQIIRRQRTTVVEGTGSFSGVVFGDEVPIEVRVSDPVGVDTATTLHRSRAPLAYTTSPMSRVDGTPREGRWRTLVPRPPGLETTFEYYVEITNRAGDKTTYGSASLPLKIQLLDPTTRK